MRIYFLEIINKLIRIGSELVKTNWLSKIDVEKLKIKENSPWGKLFAKGKKWK